MRYGGYLKSGTKIEVLMFKPMETGIVITYDGKDNTVESTQVDLLWTAENVELVVLRDLNL